MKFGRLSDPSAVHFCLPEMEDALFGWPGDDAISGAAEPAAVGSGQGGLQLYVGAPVWACDSYVGKIYSSELKSTEYLGHYAENFNCIELNSTFYGVPRAERIAHWCSQVGSEFRFCPKGTRNITHDFSGLPRRAVADFFRSMDAFGAHLGICFFQFPERLGPTYWRHLRALLQLVPRGYQVAVELRHPDWFAKRAGIEWLLELGNENDIAFVITDTSGRRDVLHHCFPQRFGSIRFVGDALVATDFDRLDQWTERLRQLQLCGLRTVYFFVHQEREGDCVELAAHLGKNMPEAGLPTIRRVAGPAQQLLW